MGRIDPLLTASDVAAILRLELETVRDMMRRKILPAVKVGNRWRMKQSCLFKFIEDLGVVGIEEE